MPRKAKMSYRPAPYYDWTKMVSGVRYKVKCSELPIPRELWTWEGSYQAANAWWDAKQSTLAPKESESEKFARMIDKMRNAVVKAGFNPSRIFAADCNAVSEMLLDSAAVVPVVKPEYSLTNAIDEFCNLLSASCGARYLLEVKYYLDKLPGFLPADLRLIDKHTVTNEFNRLASEAVSQGRKKKHWAFFKRFISHCAEQGKIESPCNLASKFYSFKAQVKKVKTYTAEEVISVLASLPERLRLYALLALNTGMNNVDIGRLRHDMIVGEYLTRKRSKTESHENVPTVTYKLWPTTIALLKKFRSEHPTLWLTSQNGTPLTAQSKMDKRPDLIVPQWKVAKCSIMLKAFRSIGSNAINASKEYAHFADVFLGHSPKTIGTKNYYDYSQARFDEAIDEMGKVFGQ